MSTAAKVAEDKKRHPERYCAEPRCLWKVTRLMRDHVTGFEAHELKVDCPGGRCPRHQKVSQ